jgi:hypothetical protein
MKTPIWIVAVMMAFSAPASAQQESIDPAAVLALLQSLQQQGETPSNVSQSDGNRDPDRLEAAARLLDLLESGARDTRGAVEPSVLTPDGYTGPVAKIPIGYVASGILDFTTISDYPGPWRGTLTQPIVSPDGQYVIAPAGSRVVGTAELASGVNQPIQNRMQFTPTAFVWPDGTAYPISGQFVIDQSGVSGIADKVDYHADIIAGALVAGGIADALPGILRDRLGGGTSTAQDEGVGIFSDLAGEAGSGIDRYTRLVPTVEVRPGTPFQVFFSQEVQLPPYREQTRYRFFNEPQAKRP